MPLKEKATDPEYKMIVPHTEAALWVVNGQLRRV